MKIRFENRNLLEDTRGATAVEYALIVALVSVACVGAFTNLGEAIVEVIENVVDVMQAA